MSTKFKVIQRSLRVELPFEGILFRWMDVTPRFFAFLYERLGQRLNIRAQEFVAPLANHMGEVQARYSIYGGGTSISLKADGLVFDFPGLLPSDQMLVNEIMQSVHDGFAEAFPEVTAKRIEVQDHAHLDIGGVERVERVLSSFQSHIVSLKGLQLPVVYKPAGKFQLSADDGSWQNNIIIDRSLVNANAIFVSFGMSFKNVEWSLSFVEKQALVLKASGQCLDMLDLEFDSAA